LDSKAGYPVQGRLDIGMPLPVLGLLYSSSFPCVFHHNWRQSLGPEFKIRHCFCELDKDWCIKGPNCIRLLGVLRSHSSCSYIEPKNALKSGINWEGRVGKKPSRKVDHTCHWIIQHNFYTYNL
jgi:hypothetical protein